MRPFELRLKAIKNIEDAETLVENSPDNAFYLAGYSIEFILKARLCTARGWPHLPKSRAEKDEWNKRDGRSKNEEVFTHDLQKLLTLSNTISIRAGSFHRINWEQACSWSEQARYKPVNSVNDQEAKEYISEVRKVIDILMEYELVDTLLEKEKKLYELYGPFHCFALLKDSSDKSWQLLMAWRAPTQELYDLRSKDLKEFFDSMDEDFRGMISKIFSLSTEDPAIKSATTQAGMIGGVHHSPSAHFSNNFVAGLPVLPPGYFITAANWSIEQLKNDWQRAEKFRESLKGIVN